MRAIRDWWHETLHGFHHRFPERYRRCLCMEGYRFDLRYPPGSKERATLQVIADDLAVYVDAELVTGPERVRVSEARTT